MQIFNNLFFDEKNAILSIQKTIILKKESNKQRRYFYRKVRCIQAEQYKTCYIENIIL